MNIYISTGALPYQQISDILAFSLAHGFDRLELSSTVAYSPDILEHVRKAHGRIHFLVHNYFPPPVSPFVLNLASTEPTIHCRSVELCNNSIDLSTKLKAPFYSVHSGFAVHLTPDMLGNTGAQCRLGPSKQIPRKKSYQRFVRTVRELAGYAQSKGIQLLVENNVIPVELADKHGKNVLLLASSSEILRFITDVNNLHVGLLLDTGHLNVTANTLGFDRMAFVEQVAPHVRAIHVHDNDGTSDTHQPIQPNSWVIDVLHRPEFTGLPLIVEAKFDDITELCQHISWLKNEMEKK